MTEKSIEDFITPISEDLCNNDFPKPIIHFKDAKPDPEAHKKK